MAARFPASAPLLLLAAGCATASPMAAGDTISISERWHYAFCVGSCLSYDLAVRGDGLVEVQQVSLDEEHDMERYQVSPAQAARFAEKLRRYRPQGVKGTPTCDHTGFDLPELIKEVVEVEITWSGPAGDRLYSCHDPELREAIGQALREIELYPGADQLVSGERDAARAD